VTPAAYAQLTPQQVLDTLDGVGLRGDGRILQLNSYENRVFQVMLEDGAAVVAKFYRPARWTDGQILEEHSFALELAAAEVPVVPPRVLQRADDHAPHGLVLRGDPPTLAVTGHGSGAMRCAVADRCAGREPELADPAVLRQIGRFIGRLHAVGLQRPFAHRPTMSPAADAKRAVDALCRGGFVVPDVLPAWVDAAGRASEAIAAAFDRHGPLRLLRLHGDCHPGNVLWRAEGPAAGPHLVDLDDAVNGPAVQDLWMLACADAAALDTPMRELLAGYEDFMAFDGAELALVEPLRTLRMLRHSAWLAARWTDPSFPPNFPYFGSAAYWTQQTAQLCEQLELMQPLRRSAGG
jgi:Ser/Thr protein kinase RdoA (MazF antagonist)